MDGTSVALGMLAGNEPEPDPERLAAALASDAPDRFLKAMEIDVDQARKVGEAKNGDSYFKVTNPRGLSCVVNELAGGACASPQQIAAGRGWGTEVCPPRAATPTVRIRGQIAPDVSSVTLVRADGGAQEVAVTDGFFLAELDLGGAQRNHPAELRWTDDGAERFVKVPLAPDFDSLKTCPDPSLLDIAPTEDARERHAGSSG